MGDKGSAKIFLSSGETLRGQVTCQQTTEINPAADESFLNRASPRRLLAPMFTHRHIILL